MSCTTTLPCILLALGGPLAAVEVEAAKLATADAQPVSPGSWEVALGASWTRCRDAYDNSGQLQDRGGDASEGNVEVGLTLGLLAGLDAGFTAGYSRITDDSADPDSGNGLTDVGLGVKWRFLDDEHCALALLPEFSIPVGDGHSEDRISTGSDLWGAGLSLVSSIPLEPWSVGASIGHSWVFGSAEDRGDARGEFHVDAALGYQATDMVQPELEVHYLQCLNANETPDAWTLAATVGVLVSTSHGRFGLGLDQVVLGENADQCTTLLLQWVKGF